MIGLFLFLLTENLCSVASIYLNYKVVCRIFLIGSLNFSPMLYLHYHILYSFSPFMSSPFNFHVYFLSQKITKEMKKNFSNKEILHSKNKIKAVTK